MNAHVARTHATPIILKSILDVADPRAPTRGRTWANARYWTAILKKAGATVNRRLHGALVTFTSPESHLVSLSIQSLKKKKSASERDEAESSARELSFGPDTHLYIPNWLTFTRELSFLERSGHQSTFFYFFVFLFFFSSCCFLLSWLFRIHAE